MDGDQSFPTLILDGCETIQEDEILLNLLKEWDLQKIYLLLRSAGIGAEELRYLNESDLDKVFPSFETIGVKAKFRQKLKTWKKDKFGEDDTVVSAIEKVKRWIKDTENQCVISSTSGSPKTSEMGVNCLLEIDLEKILQQTPRGQDVLEYFKENNTLTPYHQQSISNCVIDNFVATRRKLTLKNLETIANKICAFFPGEQEATYYCRRGTRNRPCGKIYDRYFNYRKERNMKGSKTICSAEQDQINLNSYENVEIDDTLAQNMKIWLKYNDNPTEEIIDKWKKTYIYRKNALRASLEKKETISSFLSEWPLYKNGTLGPCLIDCDFNMLYPNKNMNLLSKWEFFVSKIKQFYNNNIKDKSSREMLSNLNHQLITMDSQNYIIAVLLNAVITPVARYQQDKKPRKVTIREGMDSFILHIHSSAKLEEEIINIRQRFSQENITLQPTIVVVGKTVSTADEFFLYLDGIKLKFPSFLAALDTCFKVFQIFDLQYPIYCKGVWLFIQKFFFEIDTLQDEHQPKVSGLISHLKSLLSQN